jgi:hypothetical protein
MRFRLSWVLLSLFSALSLRAQVEVKLEFEQNQFLPSETAEIVLRMINDTGAPLRLGEQKGWLRFSVENIDGTVVSRLEDPEDTGAFTLKPSNRGTLRFNLAPLFKLDQIGRYRVTATVVIGAANEHVVTAPVEFEIMRGVILWEREFGVTGSPGTRRKYMIQQANYLQRPRLFASVADPTGATIFRVVRLGTTVSFNPPSEFRIDAGSRLHVLHQVGADEFIHHRINADGEVEIRNLYGNRTGRPELGMNDEGEVAVIHARRKPSPGDIPGPVTAKAIPVPVPDAKPATPNP